VVLDDGAVLENGEVLPRLLRPPERFPIGLAHVVHELVLVDDVPLQIHPPGPQHQLARPIEHVNAGALKPNSIARQLDGAAEDQVGVVERVDRIERRQQRGQLPAGRAVLHHLWDRCLRAQDDRPIHAPAPRHGEQTLVFPGWRGELKARWIRHK
jgi:hypothetical protein